MLRQRNYWLKIKTSKPESNLTAVKKYKTGFTAGSLLLKEAEALIDSIDDFQAYLDGKEDLDETVVQVKSEVTRRKIVLNLNRRFKTLDDPHFFEIFQRSDSRERSLLLFYISLKCYSIIADFMLETVLPKWNNLDYELTIEDFQNFLFLKSDTHLEIDKLKESSRTKMAQVVMRMLREVGILIGDKLQNQHFENEALELIVKNDDQWFLDAVLISNEDKKLLLGL